MTAEIAHPTITGRHSDPNDPHSTHSPGAAPHQAEPSAPVMTAHRAGLVGCRSCGRVWPDEESICARCGAHLVPPDRRCLQAVWAWLVAGLIFYIPANLFPMLKTQTLAGFHGNTESTIIGGAIELARYGNWGVATIVFLASIVVPVGKFVAISWLALRAGRPATVEDAHNRLRIFEVVEFIGRWSMIDVFVVAILSALVQLGFVASIHPGSAAVCFALSVAFTMLSAQSFDPRLIWRGLPLRNRASTN